MSHWLPSAGIVAVMLAAGCAPRQTAGSRPIPAPREPPPTLDVPDPTETPPVATPAEAYRREWMPLAATGVDRFREEFPTYDGRGVLIGILDGGVDPGVAGLAFDPSGHNRRLLDARDFSGEGRVELVPLSARGDTITLGEARVAGLSRINAFVARNGPRFMGVLREVGLGTAPAADLDGNGRADDAFLLVVVRASDGWVVFTDTDRDGSLANEKPIHDFLQGGETLTWRRPGGAPPLTLAVNLEAQRVGEGPPTLDLYFDTSGHGTHVAGIAAGASMYGVDGFDGVAPGASLLALKIANDAHGGISTTGSMIEAIEYAIGFARARNMPLVLNMSFGVGNEREGTAPIDRMIDSVLAVHPDVVFTISAGNDGPGFSTLGFPGTARRIISVGATFPTVFLGSAAAGGQDPIAFFSSRGGEISGPHIVTPGMAYSTVPPWDRGSEVKNGTSMAAPQAAGLAARLVSALVQEGRPISAAAIRQALMVTAHPVGQASFLDEGAGVPDLPDALEWLREDHAVESFRVEALGHGVDAAFRAHGLSGPGDTLQRFKLVREGATGRPATTYTLESAAAWLKIPPTVRVGDSALVTLTWDAAALEQPGIYTALVTGWDAGAGRRAGPAFRIVNTIAVPRAADDSTEVRLFLPGGEGGHVAFVADSGRPFLVRVQTETPGAQMLAFLHEPGGMPWRVQPVLAAGAEDEAAVFDVDGRDVVPGVYEVVSVAQPGAGTQGRVRIVQAPFRLALSREAANRTDRQGKKLVASLTSLASSPKQALIAVGLRGAERSIAIGSRGSEAVRVPISIPAWARSGLIQVDMDPTQWPRFTDFGLTLETEDGRILETSPLNYATGRLEFDATPLHGRDFVVVLRPGFAVPASDESWALQLSIRFYAEQPVLADLPDDGSHGTTLAPGATHRAEFAMPAVPWSLDPAFFPLGFIIAQADDRIWSREVPLPTPTLPVQP